MSAAQTERGASGARRFSGILLLGAAVILLFAGVLMFDRAHDALPQAEQELALAEKTLSNAHISERLAQRNQVLLKNANAMQMRAQSVEVLPQTWGERQINLRQQNLMREDINQLLTTTARGKGQLFKLEEFELSVTKSDEGLFEKPETPNQPVLVTLRGIVHFRISERSL